MPLLAVDFAEMVETPYPFRGCFGADSMVFCRNNMDIGFITAAYKPAPGGVTTSVESFAEQLEKLGHRVTIFCPTYPQQTEDIADVKRIRSFLTPIIPDFRITDPLEARRIFSNNFPALDLIHIHLPTLMSRPARKIAQKNGLPFFFTYHTHLELYLGHYLPLIPAGMSRQAAKWYTRLTTRGGATIFTPSKDLKEVLKGYSLKPPIKVLPTGIALSFYEKPRSSVRERYGIGPDEKMVLYVGRIGSEKNIDFLLKAFDQIRQKYPNCHFVMVGGGRGMERALRQRSRLGLEETIHFPGYIEDREEVAAHYQSSDLFIFASLTETQGLVILESFASNTPVVAVDAPGIRDFMAGNRGGFLTEMDLEKFSNTAVQLLQDQRIWEEKTREGKEVAREYSTEAMAVELLETYKRHLVT